jgi:hypothetical protein
MRRIRILSGTVALLALAASAVADAPIPASASGRVLCSTTGAACPLLCDPCPFPCSTSGASAQECSGMAVASR